MIKSIKNNDSDNEDIYNDYSNRRDGAGVDECHIRIHKDFAVWVLANRPGHPFMGNNFFANCGDIFSTHSISNPDIISEMALLKNYAPDVDEAVLKALSNSFSELRNLVSDGVIAYPYSTRELVAVVKHLQAFPNDGVVSVLENVLSFDANELSLRRTLSDVFGRHGIPVPLVAGDRVSGSVMLAKEQVSSQTNTYK